MLSNKTVIKAWLDHMNIENYTIDNTGSVTVEGDDDISNKQLVSLPTQFQHVSGNFNCSRNPITKLDGLPATINGNLYLWEGEASVINDHKKPPCTKDEPNPVVESGHTFGHTVVRKNTRLNNKAS